MNYKTVGHYEKFKAKNLKINLKSDDSRSKHVLVSARNLSLGYDQPILKGVNLDLSEGKVIEFRGRNGAGKTTLIKYILGDKSVKAFDGELTVDRQTRIGIYEQEVTPTYFDLPLDEAIETMYLSRDLSISTTKIRNLMSDYLFTERDAKVPIRLLSGGQKARFQLITMLANDPQLLILDEPTNHLDLPSIEELETALDKYSGAIIYVSHDGYFRSKILGDILKIGAQ
jgi:ATPase subunit of ABC transporter with duplicated ATPase domains